MLRANDEAAPEVYRAIARLLQHCFRDTKKPFYQAGAKAFLLELLYHLAVQFRSSAMVKWEFVRQQERSLRLKKLFDHITTCPSEKLSLASAACLVGMTPAQFMKAFKQVAGMTLIAYLNHVRLSNGARLLVETHQTVGEIAHAAGFSDQSYFDKLFKRSFGFTLVKFRAQALTKISS